MGTTGGGGAAPIDETGRPRRWARIVLVGGVALSLLAVSAVAATLFLLHRYTGAVHQEHLLGGAAATASASGSAAPVHASIDGPINILLVGIDERVGQPADGARSDTVIIMHITAAHDRAYLISIPRDSRVPIPAYPKTGYPGGTDKINAAFAFGFLNNGGRAGGFELLALTIKQLTGLTFNAGAIVNFAGFQSVVDAVGGVDLCVDERTTSVHIGWDPSGKETPPYELVPPDYHPVRIAGVRPQVYEPGCQHMAGWQALDYVRQRELIPDGDYGRERHQQQFLKALAKKIASVGLITDPLRADSVLRGVADSITFDGNGVSLADWIFNLAGIDASHITMIKTNGGQYNTQVINGVDFEILTDTSLQLFQAVHDDTLASFLAAHPDWLATDAAPASPGRPVGAQGQ